MPKTETVQRVPGHIGQFLVTFPEPQGGWLNQADEDSAGRLLEEAVARFGTARAVASVEQDGRVTMRTTCEKGHQAIIRSAREWFFGSDADFCSKKVGRVACEARVVKQEYEHKDANRWLPVPED